MISAFRHAPQDSRDAGSPAATVRSEPRRCDVRSAKSAVCPRKCFLVGGWLTTRIETAANVRASSAGYRRRLPSPGCSGPTAAIGSGPNPTAGRAPTCCRVPRDEPWRNNHGHSSCTVRHLRPCSAASGSVMSVGWAAPGLTFAAPVTVAAGARDAIAGSPGLDRASGT